MTLGDRLGVHPGELRPLGLSIAGAFLVVAFMILARSLREALYLTTFPVETLPYVMGAVALLSVPTVGWFARRLAGRTPRRVLRGALLLFGAGLLAVWPVVESTAPAVVAFYLITALGTLVFTSGFWLVTAELFPVRGAKRLFGFIGAGGTAGAMVMGNSVGWLTERLSSGELVLGLVLLVAVFLAIQRALPAADATGAGAPGEGREADGDEDGTADRAASPDPVRRSSVREAFAALWRDPHLRILALVVCTATMASALVDYQFKELASATIPGREGLAGFFGAFYGWTGAAALLLQLFVAARLITRTGLAVTLAVLPVLLLLGSTALLVAPGLAIATAVRGADNTLRKSLHRSAVEVLYVPVGADLRRKTKAFVDSVVDSLAEGLGAAIVFLWVTVPGFPSRWLSLFAAALAGVFLHLAWRMGRQYRHTVARSLRDGVPARAPSDPDLLSVTFTRFDLEAWLEATSEPEPGRRAEDVAVAGVATGPRTGNGTPAAPGPRTDDPTAGPDGDRPPTPPTDGGRDPLADPDPAVVRVALSDPAGWTSDRVPALARLLARDALHREVAEILSRIGPGALPHLRGLLVDEGTDFVIRRRIPYALAAMPAAEADAALLEGLGAGRFEVRYRACTALVHRRRHGLARAPGDVGPRVWAAIRREVSLDRPVWELQRLLDDGLLQPPDDLVVARAGERGELSLEHTFRLLSLVVDADAVRAAFHALRVGDERARSLALEYLEQVLPADVRSRLWPFVGDLSPRMRRRAIRPLDAVVKELVTTEATLFASDESRRQLRRLARRPEGAGGRT